MRIDTTKKNMALALHAFADAIAKKVVADMLGTPDPMDEANQRIRTAIETLVNLYDEPGGVALPSHAQELFSATMALNREQQQFN